MYSENYIKSTLCGISNMILFWWSMFFFTLSWQSLTITIYCCGNNGNRLNQCYGFCSWMDITWLNKKAVKLRNVSIDNGVSFLIKISCKKARFSWPGKLRAKREKGLTTTENQEKGYIFKSVSGKIMNAYICWDLLHRAPSISDFFSPENGIFVYTFA